MALTELFAPATAAADGDFDRLMVPFLCVASDLNHRGPVVLREGDLSEAVRSSMSIPLVFKPMVKDSTPLYDGGIYDNFPWKPLDEDFRPDLIVGSICTEGNTPPSEESNIMDQAFMLAMHDTDYTLPEERSVTIRRAVGVNMLDFDQAEAIMNAGYEDAVAAMPQLLEKVAERRDSAYYAGRREAFRAKCPPLVFDDYKLEGLKRAQREYIRDFVQVDRRTPGIQRPMGFEELKDNLFEVLAGGDFTMDFPTVRYDSVRERYSFEAKFGTRPNFKIILGETSPRRPSTRPISASITRTSAASRSSWAQTSTWADLHLGSDRGPDGFLRVEADIPRLFLQFRGPEFPPRLFRQRHQGPQRPAGQEQRELLSTGVGMPLTHRSLLTLRANAGHINYRYDSDVLFADDTDHSRFSFFGLRAGSPAIRSTSSSIPAAVPNCISRPSMSPDATNTSLTMRKTSFRAKPDSGSEGVFRGTSSSMCRASAGSRSV